MMATATIVGMIKHVNSFNECMDNSDMFFLTNISQNQKWKSTRDKHTELHLGIAH